MTPERYRQIIELFQATSDRDPKARPQFLAEACAGDNDLQQEVEAMLSADAQPGGFLEQTPGDLAADLLDDAIAGRPGPGVLLGPYRIERLLAAGAMARGIQAVA